MTTSEPSTVCYTARLPLSWLAEPAPNESTLVRLRQTNISLLHALAGIEAATEHEHDPDTHLMKTLERLESKIDIALSLLARYGNGQIQLPPPVPVTLSARQIEWNEAAVPDVGREITLFVYLSPKLPEPLVIRSRVASVTPVFGGFRCVAELLDLDEEFLEWMTRTVFRYHRRTLQARRQQ